MELISS